MASTVRRSLRVALVSALRVGLNVSGGRARRLLFEALKVDEQSVPLVIETVVTSHGPINFYCLGALPLWRVRTLFTKEPETIEWIDSFAEGDVFWDIGANVGIYSLYAAAKRVHVVAFEPAAGNYYLLNRNIELNGFADRVEAYCVALSDETSARSLNMQMTELGGALSSFGEPVDNFGKRFTPGFRQGMIGYAVDSLIGAFPHLFHN